MSEPQWYLESGLGWKLNSNWCNKLARRGPLKGEQVAWEWFKERMLLPMGEPAGKQELTNTKKKMNFRRPKYVLLTVL